MPGDDAGGSAAASPAAKLLHGLRNMSNTQKQQQAASLGTVIARSQEMSMGLHEHPNCLDIAGQQTRLAVTRSADQGQYEVQIPQKP